MGTGLCCRPAGSAADHLRRLCHGWCDLVASKMVAAPISLIVCYFSIGTDETLLFAPWLGFAGIQHLRRRSGAAILKRHRSQCDRQIRESLPKLLPVRL